MKEKIFSFSRAKADAAKPLPMGERVFGFGIVVVSVLMVLVFVSHQMQSTGFYKGTFGTMESLMLYGFWAFWITTASLEAIFNQRLFSRMVDTFVGVFFAAISLSWLAIIFPFDFANFSDVLPESIRFLFQWISNDIARVIIALLVPLHLAAAIYCPIAYKFVVVKPSKNENFRKSNRTNSR